ncbi:DUF3343 domain-containing protein [Lachnospiraceae bacterium LCP25S3_G4]
MEKKGCYYVMAFDTTMESMKVECLAKNLISVAIMPVPREISSGCGLAIRFIDEPLQKIQDFCINKQISGHLYCMEKRRVQGRHPIKEIDTH